MLKKSFIIIFLSSLFFYAISSAQEKAGLKVEEMVFCTAIKGRQPLEVDTTFSDTVERVYCYIKITGATDATTISHVWYFNNREKAKVNLKVKSKSWRTWSSKRIVKQWAGKWRVDVVSSKGDLIDSKEFTIKPTSE